MTLVLKFPGNDSVGSSVGIVVGTFNDVDSVIDRVGSAMISDVVGSGTGSTGNADMSSCWGRACGAAATRAAKRRVTMDRMLGWQVTNDGEA